MKLVRVIFLQYIAFVLIFCGICSAGDGWLKSSNYVFNAIWGTSARNVFGVNSDGIFHFAGSGWSTMECINQGNFNDIWGFSDNCIWAIGDSGVILFYDGTNWSLMDSKVLNNLNAIWGVSRDCTFVVGDNGTILAYDGANWNKIETEISENLNAIWGSSESDIYAVGDNGKILHFNGVNWNIFASPTFDQLIDVWGNNNGKLFLFTIGEIFFREEGVWMQSSLIGENIVYLGVFGDSDGYAYAFGLSWTGQEPIAKLEWGGIAWSSFPFEPSNFVNEIWISPEGIPFVSCFEGVFLPDSVGCIANYDGIVFHSTPVSITVSEVPGFQSIYSYQGTQIGCRNSLVVRTVVEYIDYPVSSVRLHLSHNESGFSATYDMLPMEGENENYYEAIISGLQEGGCYQIVYQAENLYGVSSNSLTSNTFCRVDCRGDINGDESVDLADAILALRVLAGDSTVSDAIRDDYVPSGADVSNDIQVGMEEALFVLGKVAAVR